MIAASFIIMRTIQGGGAFSHNGFSGDRKKKTPPGGSVFFLFLVARGGARPAYSTVTDFARLRGLSTSVPRASAV